MKWIDATDLKNWAPRRDCQEHLPLLVRRLIRATTEKLSHIFFPAGDSIIYPGWDGELQVSYGTEYIPEGYSVWEFGTSEEVKSKAESDYQKRTNNPLRIEPIKTTFIIITPRSWVGKDDWRNEKKKEGKWKDIRVYDGRILEEWIEQAPAIGVWLAEYLNIYPRDVISAEDFWAEWISATKPNLSSKLVISGRKEESEKVRNWLNMEPSLLTVQAISEEESLAFLIASADNFPVNEKDNFFSRCIVVHKREDLRHLIITRNSLILVNRFGDTDLIGKAVQNGHYVYYPIGRDNYVSKEKIVLPRPGREEFISALKEIGLSEDDANKYSMETGRSLSVLRRKMSPASIQPDWAKEAYAREIIPILLASRWNEHDVVVQITEKSLEKLPKEIDIEQIKTLLNKDFTEQNLIYELKELVISDEQINEILKHVEKKISDRDIISLLAGEDYDTFTEKLSKWLLVPDPPVYKIGDFWRLTSPMDAWFALASYITSGDFARFKKVVLEVFGEVDPALELEPYKRWMASVYGKEKRYSENLRDGIAQTLVIMAVFGDEVKLQITSTSQSWVDELVKALLYKADWEKWSSLSNVLPLLAEASPSSFLDAVDESLFMDIPPIMGMFSESNDPSTSRSYHTGLLWALEELAWDPFLLSRVTIILGKLSKLDPGGKLQNSPLNSLMNIFLLWIPQSYASSDLRIKVLDLLLREEPAIGWTLIISLIPSRHTICIPSHKTRWRQFSDIKNNIVTPLDFNNNIKILVEKICNHAGYDGDRWSRVVKRIQDLSYEDRQKIISQLNLNLEKITDNRIKLWDTLRDVLSKHRSLPEAHWALPETELKDIEKIYLSLEPLELRKSFAWLFDSYSPDLPDGSNISNYRIYLEIIDLERKKALEKIIERDGIEEIFILVREVRQPGLLGKALALMDIEINMEERLPYLLNGENKNELIFAQSYVGQYAYYKGKEWMAGIIKKFQKNSWSLDSIVNFFISLPDNRDIWAYVESCGNEIKTEYWKKCRPDLHSLSYEEKLFGIEQLLSVNRFFTVLNIASLIGKDLPAALIAEILEKTAFVPADPEDKCHFEPHNIINLFNFLDKADIDDNQLAQLEWDYVTILTGICSLRRPKILHKALAEDPSFFAQVIKWAYKSQNNAHEEDMETFSQELIIDRGKRAHELLDSWKILPGSNSEGQIDPEKLLEWVKKARQVCTLSGRGEVGDIHIGEILACAKGDKEDYWPPDSVCLVIDTVNSSKMDSGFYMGILNKRVVRTRSHGEGGQQERILVSRFKQLSEKLCASFPRTSSILREVAEHYENAAKRVDIKAEKEDLEY